MSTGMPKDKSIRVTVFTTEGERFVFDEPTTRDEARQLARKILAEGFALDGTTGLRPGEEQYFPPAVVYKVAIHKSTHA